MKIRGNKLGKGYLLTDLTQLFSGAIQIKDSNEDRISITRINDHIYSQNLYNIVLNKHYSAGS